MGALAPSTCHLFHFAQTCLDCLQDHGVPIILHVYQIIPRHASIGRIAMSTTNFHNRQEGRGLKNIPNKGSRIAFEILAVK